MAIIRKKTKKKIAKQLKKMVSKHGPEIVMGIATAAATSAIHAAQDHSRGRNKKHAKS
jgi:hypothetical protein